MSTATRAADQADALDVLRTAFPVGSVVYTYVTRVTASGASRRMGVVAVTPEHDGTPAARSVTILAARALGYRLNDDGTMTVPGGGMDMGFHVAHSLSTLLHRDGYALSHRWL